jgi:lysophosphatidate acyltransferase
MLKTAAAGVSYFLLAYAALVIVFYMLSALLRPCAFVARSLAAYACIVAASLFGLVTAPILRVAGYGGLSQHVTGRFFAWAVWLTCGVSFYIVDPENILGRTRPAVFVGNHQTELDVLMLGTMFPRYCSVTAKSTLRKFPVLGPWMAASGSIFIDRANSKDARDAMRGAAAEITSRKQSVYMFPEGTRSYGEEPSLLPFKKGAFHLAVEAGVPIVPCVVANYSHVLSVKGLIFRSGRIPVKVMDPIPTTGLTSADVEELTRKTREAMLRELIILSAEAKGQPVPDPASSTDDSSHRAVASGVDTTVGSL